MKNKNMTNYGYCCINMQLRKQKPSVTTNRSMIKRTFEVKGPDYASELIVQNVRDLREIIKWNHANGIKLYRLSSDIMPWMSEYNISDLKDFRIIRTILEDCGDLAREYGQRLTFHPGPFDVDNFHLLDPSVKSRLVVENDDKQKQYAVEDLYQGIHSKIGIPITFDYHHHWCHPGELTQEEALKMASTTWPKGIKQLCHYSSCKQIHEDASVMARAHADYIYEHINTYGLDLDIELEAKAKELAVQKYVKQFCLMIQSVIPIV